MFVLLETFTKQELHLATNMLNRFADKVSQLLIGVNCRDLNTLQVDFSNFTKLAADLPNTAMCVAESGVHDLDDLQRIIEMGFGSVLIGSALMQSDNPRTTLNEMKEFARKTMAARQ
jgi:indole-3-glycerol phosphate synthase